MLTHADVIAGLVAAVVIALQVRSIQLDRPQPAHCPAPGREVPLRGRTVAVRTSRRRRR